MGNIAQLPANIEAERSVIYSILFDNLIISEVISQLTEEDFFSEMHRIIYKAIAILFDQDRPVEYVTLNNYLSSHPEMLGRNTSLDQVRNYLIEILDTIASPKNIQSYVDIVRDKSLLRSTIITLNTLTEEASTQPDNTEMFIDQIQQQIFKLSLSSSRKDVVDFKSALQDFYKDLQLMKGNNSSITGVPTGFKKLDEFTSGLQPSDLIILAARPSMGKTSFAVNLAVNAAKADKSVAIFSLEMPVNQLMNRIISSEANINASRLRMGNIKAEEWGKVGSTITRMIDHRIFIDETAGISSAELSSKARTIAMKDGLDLIVIDYLQLMKGNGKYNSRELEISDISQSLKALAKELRVPVIALSQLNRSLEKRPNKRPILSDLRESGAIEQDADLIMFIYRGEVYDDKEAQEGTAEIIIGKNRNGPIGYFLTVFQKDFTRFDNIMEEEYNGM